MAFLQLSSTNPRMSHVLSKNPASGLLGKSCGYGHLFGFFTEGKDNQYNIWFREGDIDIRPGTIDARGRKTEDTLLAPVTYKLKHDDAFEYMNTTRYNSPMFVVNAIGEVLTSALNKPSPDDVLGFEHEMTINLMFIAKMKYVEIFQQSFPDFKLTATEIAPSNFRVTIGTNRSIRDLLMFTSTFALFVTLKSNTWVRLDEGLIGKAVKHVVALDSPFFLRYVLKANLLRGRKTIHAPTCTRRSMQNDNDEESEVRMCGCPTVFQHFKPLLEKHGKQDIKLTYGDTTSAREDFVITNLATVSPILDIGCGEGNYVRLLAPRTESEYIAVDMNPKCVEEVQELCKRKQIENVTTYASFGDVPAEKLAKKTNVLLIEVIEHMPLPNAGFVLREIFQRVNLGKLLITTPNKDFNQHFGFDDEETRHADHHFEFTPKEFEAFMVANVPAGYKVRFVPIGDSVDGVSMGLGAVVEAA